MLKAGVQISRLALSVAGKLALASGKRGAAPVMWTPAGIIAILFCAACSLDVSSRGPFGPCGSGDPRSETIAPPAHVPARHVLEFTADESPGHVKPKMAGATMDAGVTRSPSPIMPLSVRDVASMRNAAEADPVSPPCWAHDGDLSMPMQPRRRAKFPLVAVRSAHDSPDSPTSAIAITWPSTYA